MKVMIVLCSLLIFNSVLALESFSKSLEDRLGISSARVLEVGDKIRIKFGKFSRGSTAAASYNPIFNTIKFNKDLQSIRTKKLKTISELRKESPYSYQVSLATIFHELGHAELDTIIEESKTGIDRDLYNTLNDEVEPWFKRNFPRIKSWDGVHELYGYYRTSVIEILFQEIDSILLQNGINQYQSRCFLPQRLKELIKTQSREEFSNLQVLSNDNSSLDEKVSVQYIFIRGRDYNLADAREVFKKRWFQAMWKHLQKVYDLPTNKTDLLEHLNNWSELEFISSCRQKLWDDYHSMK
ncbi:hypothetical protein BIY24_00250 [Halobacteriovorax marinus]|uniref:hypothetical protein n=1 Tax=Halobacteriovorax marinus TaxID=97084 RepID=UPI000BC34E30|nr:hypothetical protein [Halobacteriovorax marinus]ATH06425.1 hypothetical protein BIY24_00250 [Halobacteriovorax marinus]